MIQLQEVSKIYEGNSYAVEHISLEVAKGEVFGLIGTSGCGKTTTLKMINRLVEPSEGHILINGESIRKRPAEELRRNIGYVIQSVGLFPHYTIEENVAIVPNLLKWDPGIVRNRSREMLQLVGLDPEIYASRKPKALSGGQQQRVGLARALAGDPELLLMDEPFGALDPITKQNIREEFKKLLGEIEKTVILVTHDVIEAFDLCDRICIMDAGKVQQTGSAKELLFHPVNEFVRTFLNSHRFQLEMMSLSLQDLLDGGYLALEKDLESGRGALEKSDFSPRSTVFSILDSQAEEVLVTGTDGGRVLGRVSRDQVLDGYRELAKSLRRGNYG